MSAMQRRKGATAPKHGDTCPNAAKHIEGPSNYVGHFEWRKEMSKTHTVSRCPDCMRFVIWTPKDNP